MTGRKAPGEIRGPSACPGLTLSRHACIVVGMTTKHPTRIGFTPTGQARGPIEMHHHRKPAPPLTPTQRRVIETNRKAAKARRSDRPALASQVADPFDLLPAPEPDLFA